MFYRSSAQPMQDVFFSLLRACTNAPADVVTLDQFVVMLQEGAGEGWDKSPEAYVEVCSFDILNSN